MYVLLLFMLSCVQHSWESWSWSLLEDLDLSCRCLCGVHCAAGPGKLAFFADLKYSSVLALLRGVINVVSDKILFWMPFALVAVLLSIFFPGSHYNLFSSLLHFFHNFV